MSNRKQIDKLIRKREKPVKRKKTYRGGRGNKIDRWKGEEMVKEISIKSKWISEKRRRVKKREGKKYGMREGRIEDRDRRYMKNICRLNET